MKSENHSRSRGSILILSLWVISFLSILSVTIAYGARQKATLLNRFTSYDRLHAIALSGIEQARAVVRETEPGQRFSTFADPWALSAENFRQKKVELGFFSVGYERGSGGKGQPVVYGLKDENSKINLNTADVPTLTRLFESAGVDHDTAEDIGYSVVDWRDGDSALGHPTHGAETPYYNDLKMPYSAKNAPFEIIDELLLVKGVNRAIFDKVKELVTVYGSGAVNINTAQKEALVALGIEAGMADRILAFRRGTDGTDGTADDGYLAMPGTIAADLKKILSLNDIEEQTLKTLVSAGKLGTTSNFFSAKSRASLGETGPTMEMDAVIGIDGKIYYIKASQILWPS